MNVTEIIRDKSILKAFIDVVIEIEKAELELDLK